MSDNTSPLFSETRGAPIGTYQNDISLFTRRIKFNILKKYVFGSQTQSDTPYFIAQFGDMYQGHVFKLRIKRPDNTFCLPDLIYNLPTPNTGYYYPSFSYTTAFNMSYITGSNQNMTGTYTIYLYVDDVLKVTTYFYLEKKYVMNTWNFKITVPVTNTGNVIGTFYADCFVKNLLFGGTEPSITLLPGTTGNLEFNGSLSGFSKGSFPVNVNVYKAGDTNILQTNSDWTILEVVG